MLPVNMLFENKDIFGDFDETSSSNNIKGFIEKFFFLSRTLAFL